MRGIGDRGRTEDGSNRFSAPLQVREILVDARVERFTLHERGLGDALLAEVAPDELVGIEIGGITGEKVEFEPASQALNVAREHLRPMRRMAIEDEDDPSPPTPEALDEAEERSRVQLLRERLVPEGSLGVHRGDGIHRLPLAARRDHGRLSAESPCSSKRSVGADAGFIEEEDLRAPALGALPDGRILLARPFLDRGRITLVGSAQRFLGRDAEASEKSPDADHVHLDPELIPDELADQVTSPEAEVEAVLTWILPVHPTNDLCLLPGRELPLGSGRFRRSERGEPSALRGTKPPVDGGPAEAIAGDHRARSLAIADPLDRVETELLEHIVGKNPAVASFHTELLSRRDDDV